MSNANVYDTVSTDTEEDTSEVVIDVEQRQLTLEEKVDIIGAQMNWLCENLTGLFTMVSSLSTNGGGLRGLMKAMKEANNE